MAELLIELLSEEIPARMQLQAAKDFERLFSDRLKGYGLSFDAIKAYVGPRRLCLKVDGVPLQQAAVSEEVKGPREGAPPQALEGFLRKVGLSQDQVLIENGVYVARIVKPAQDTHAILPELLHQVILAFPWPKSMRSGSSKFTWVRPIKRILFLFDGAVVPFELEGIVASDLTQGHRFLGQTQPIMVTDFASYAKALADNSVILDHAERQQIILDQARRVCSEAGCSLIEDQGLLEEVAGLNEYPIALLGDMDPQFLTLPPEVIKTSMRTHQKYFSVRGNDGKMAAKFVIVSNMKALDGGAEIKRGNAKVLSARLSDAVFFWTEDQKAGNFDRWNQKLSGVTFHAKLGTMQQRVLRLTALAQNLAPSLRIAPDLAQIAAQSCKSDLACAMVGEFPELQGIMGGYYARLALMGESVADAIADHYRPQGPNDGLPETPLGALLALADKLDTLACFFAIDEKPTGSKDPFALRRACLGVLRIMRAQAISLDLRAILKAWYHGLLIYADQDNCVYVDTAQWRGSAGPRWAKGESEAYLNTLKAFKGGLLQSDVLVMTTERDHDFEIAYEHIDTQRPMPASHLRFRSYEVVAPEFEAFFRDRLKVMLKDEGLGFGAIDAVMAASDVDLTETIARIETLDAALKLPQGEAALAAYKRAANIIAAEAKKGTLPQGSVQAHLLIDESEKALLSALTTASNVSQKMEMAQALSTLAMLKPLLDHFLETCLVNAEEEGVRINRLLLLQMVTQVMAPLADLSKLA